MDLQQHEFKTFFEPFRIKSVESFKHTTREERIRYLKEAHYNPFKLNSENIMIDLLTDSGTGAMSSEQWAAIMHGNEAYAGSPSYFRFERVVKEIFGFRHVLPTHQGPAAERILFHCALVSGDIVPNNAHFDTTFANVEACGAKAVNLPAPEALDNNITFPFKGNMNIEKLVELLSGEKKAHVPMVLLTITNNAIGGEPVSMGNIKTVSKLCRTQGIPLFFDACRFAENAWFIKTREEGYSHQTPLQIAREMFSYADGCTMSAKKDGLVNIGGFLALNNDELADKCRRELIISEGFPTYGGLAGRDLEAMAVGLRDVLAEDYLRYQIGFVLLLANMLVEKGIPVLSPPGGHAVYIDAATMLPHIPREKFPAWTLGCALYVEGGIRCGEIGGVMYGKESNPAEKLEEFEEEPNGELLRLAIPRRTYTESHMRYVAEVCEYVLKHRKKLCGYRITWAPPVLRHFTAHLEPVPFGEEEAEDVEELPAFEARQMRLRKTSIRRSSLQFS